MAGKVRKLLVPGLAGFIGAISMIYLLGYLWLKYECTSPAFVPSDPWKSSGMSMQSRVSTWGDYDVTTLTVTRTFRDPGFKVGHREAAWLNAIYAPLGKMDERLTGWSVRFQVVPEGLLESNTGDWGEELLEFLD